MRLLRWFQRKLQRRIIHKWQSEMPGFDRNFYVANNPDVAASGVDPLSHYLEYGWKEGREPSAGFTGKQYLSLNPDVEISGNNPLVHFLNYGIAEGRLGACRVEVLPQVPRLPSAAQLSHRPGDPRYLGKPSGPTHLL